jgi:hypothetical protein
MLSASFNPVPLPMSFFRPPLCCVVRNALQHGASHRVQRSVRMLFLTVWAHALRSKHPLAPSPHIVCFKSKSLWPGGRIARAADCWASARKDCSTWL